MKPLAGSHCARGGAGLGAGLFASVLLPSLLAADVQLFGVVKLQQLEQTVGGLPVSPPTGAFAFEAIVVGTTNHSVTSATVEPPANLPSRTLGSVTNGLAFWFEARFDSAAALDAAYPSRGGLISPSRYTFTIDTAHEGRRQAAVSYFGVLSSPPVARIVNLGEAQSLDTTTAFTLRWDIPGGSFLDLVQVAVTDAATNLLFASPAPLAPGALSGLSTEITVPAFTLPPGAALLGHVAVVRPGLPNTDGIPGATGLAALAKDTGFTLQTRPAPAPPRLEIVSGTAHPVRLRFLAETNRNLHLQGSSNLVDWQDLLVTNTASGVGEHTDLASGTASHRAYRIQVGP